MSYPICGDESHLNYYYYCDYDYMCKRTGGGDQALFRKIVDDSGDVCENVAIQCPC
jgi:hypothetical protein